MARIAMTTTHIICDVIAILPRHIFSWLQHFMAALSTTQNKYVYFQGDRYQVSSFSMTPLEIDEQGFTVDMGAAPPPLDSLRIIGHWQPPYRYRVL